MIRTLTLTALATLLALPAAVAQETAAAAPVNDSLFAAAASDSGLAEVGLSQLGVQKASNAELKKFSQQMVDEHNRLNQTLTTLATRRGIPLARAIDVRAQFCTQSLAGLSGEQFDHCYAKAQLLAHKEAVATFEAEAERGRDPELNAFAAKELPRIKEHLKMIEPIASKLEKDRDGGSKDRDRDSKDRDGGSRDSKR